MINDKILKDYNQILEDLYKSAKSHIEIINNEVIFSFDPESQRNIDKTKENIKQYIKDNYNKDRIENNFISFCFNELLIDIFDKQIFEYYDIKHNVDKQKLNLNGFFQKSDYRYHPDGKCFDYKKITIIFDKSNYISGTNFHIDNFLNKHNNG